MADDAQRSDPKMDAGNLYREEIFTDRGVGTIRVLTPVNRSGLTDTARKIVYVGETQVLTPAGMLPIAFEVEAGSLSEAVEKFGGAVKQAVEETIREIQQLRREAASPIVIPDVTPGGLGGPGPLGGLGGRPPRGKIQMP
jgi:hypothetical protein